MVSRFYIALFSSIFVTVGFIQEPLRGSISSQLRTSLQGINVANEILEQAVQIVTNDNLDLGCAVIEQAATDKVSSAESVFLCYSNLWK